MQTAVRKIDSTKREISVEVSGDIVKNKFDDVFKRIGKEAKVPGFRPGNAPRDILEKHYAQAAHEQVLKELLPDVFNEAVKKEALDCLQNPEVSDVKLDRVKLSFKAVVEVRPEITVKNYKGLKIEYKPVTVTPEEIKRNLDSVKESRKASNADDRLAKSLGYPGIAELERSIEKQIFIQKENQQRQRIENDILQDITKDLEFQLPQSLVERQLEELLRHAKLDLAMKGLAREKIEEQEKEMAKSLGPQARGQVKVYLVLAEIAKRENIPADDNMPQRVIELLLSEGNWIEKPNN